MPPETFGESNLLMTQTGTFAAMSGSGAPNVGALTLVVAASSSVHAGLEAVLQSFRQTRRGVPTTFGLLNELPLQPLSRSPGLAITNLNSFGPPAGFSGQVVNAVAPRH